jgi:hypothetical protein
MPSQADSAVLWSNSHWCVPYRTAQTPVRLTILVRPCELPYTNRQRLMSCTALPLCMHADGELRPFCTNLISSLGLNDVNGPASALAGDYSKLGSTSLMDQCLAEQRYVRGSQLRTLIYNQVGLRSWGRLCERYTVRFCRQHDGSVGCDCVVWGAVLGRGRSFEGFEPLGEGAGRVSTGSIVWRPLLARNA